MSDEKTLFLIDGHAMVYRAHYAFIARPLFNSKKQNVSAINGFVRSIWDIISNAKPSHLGVVFDPKGGTFRNEIYEAYKANRDAQPEDITFALPYIQKILEAMNIPVFVMPGFEADDVIGTLAKLAEVQNYQTYMVTPDKDYAQLVSSNIFQYKPARLGNDIEVLGIPEVLEKWEIKRIDQVIDILGLMGDAVDNIPGIPGVGQKTAISLLKQFDSLEGVLEHADQIKGKLAEKVSANADLARLSKQLATIKIDIPIDFNYDDFLIGGMNKSALLEIFNELEFRTLAKTILGSESDFKTTSNERKERLEFQGSLFDNESGAYEQKVGVIGSKNINNTDHRYQIIQSQEDQNALVKELNGVDIFCFDTETTGLDPLTAELVGIAISTKSHTGWYLPISKGLVKVKEEIAFLIPFLEDDKKSKIGQNLKYDISVLKKYDCNVSGPLLDTMIIHYLLEPDLRHGMDYLAESYLDYKPIAISELIGEKSKDQISMRDVPLAKIAEYATEDADITLQLYEYLYPKLKESGSESLYLDVEAPFIYVLVDMEAEGVKLNQNHLHNYSGILEGRINEVVEKIYEQAGVEFNISSPKQVGEILFDHLKIPYRWKKTKTGQYSTDEDKLTELADESNIVKDILLHRSLTKLKSTYVDSLPNMVHQMTGRIHSSFNQALAATGRLSSNNPNLQNIPIKTVEGREIRKAFIPRDEDHILLSADYSQIELRIIAELSQDENMLEAFQSGKDIHTATAAKVYDVDLSDVTSEQRRNAKTVNFSIIYGAGSTNLSNQLGIKRAEAKNIIEQYFKQFHGLKDYMERQVSIAREKGSVQTILGRNRILRDINSRNALARSSAERIAINSPIQGTAADLIKVAMIKIHREFITNQLQSKMILQVHDELIFDVYIPELEQVKKIVEVNMKNAIPNLSVPIEISMDTGQNWLEAH